MLLYNGHFKDTFEEISMSTYRKMVLAKIFDYLTDKFYFENYADWIANITAKQIKES